MAAGLIVRKAGMTQVFTEKGEAVPVTVLNAESCKVIARRSEEKDGYDAIQIGFGQAKRKKKRAIQGHYAKLGQDEMGGLKEFRIDAGEAYEIGQELTVTMFEQGQKVDVCGQSKGRGFSGAMKRWNFAGGRASHGAEKTHRQMGSTGQCQWPGRVFPGKKMPGHYGAKRITTHNLVIERIDEKANLLLVRGAVPGPSGGLIEICPTVKGA